MQQKDPLHTLVCWSHIDNDPYFKTCLSFSVFVCPASSSTNPNTHVFLRYSTERMLCLHRSPVTLWAQPTPLGCPTPQQPPSCCSPNPGHPQSSHLCLGGTSIAPGGQVFLVLRVPPSSFKAMLKIWKWHHHSSDISRWNQEIAIKTSTVKIWIIYCKSFDWVRDQLQLGLGWCAVTQGRTDVLLLLINHAKGRRTSLQKQQLPLRVQPDPAQLFTETTSPKGTAKSS